MQFRQLGSNGVKVDRCQSCEVLPLNVSRVGRGLLRHDVALLGLIERNEAFHPLQALLA
jgi:hypothetical protein